MQPTRTESLRRVSQTPLTLISTGLIGLMTIAALLVGASAAHAEFSVQIGAFMEPAPSFTEKAEAVGQLYRSKSPAGLTRLQVGRFETKEEANVARSALLGAGYADAFVVQKGIRAAAVATDSMEIADFVDSHSNTSFESESYTESYATTPSVPSADPLAGVPADLRDRVVVLDGQLNVVEGDQFTPLDQYLRNQPRY